MLGPCGCDRCRIYSGANRPPEGRNPMHEIPERGPAAFVAEFVGTFALVFFITFTVSLYVKPAPPSFQPFIDFSVIGLVHVLALFMLVQTLAVVSGAHFNPAV